MTDFLGEWEAWREARERRMRSPRGWLAITAIHWLTAEPQRFDDVPGEWRGGERSARVSLAAGEALTLGGSALREGDHDLGPLDEDGVTVSFGSAVAEVALRGDAAIVRPRHPDAPHLRAYRGTPCYAPDERWAISARFEPSTSEPDVGTPAPDEASEGIAVGEVVFAYAGDQHRLVAWGEEDGSLWILFRDATSGVTTYPANRQLVTPPPSADGRVHLDLNRAMNMPCAYTDFATCPVSPAANTLPFAVEAGERLPEMVW